MNDTSTDLQTAYLVVIDGMPFQVFPFDKESLVAGRIPDAEIHLDQLQVSRLHCRFSRKDDQYFVEDLGSRSGTRVNDQQIEAPTRLSPGARISIGLVTFAFGIGTPPASENDAPKLSEHSPAISSSKPGSDRTTHPGVPILFRGAPADSIPLADSLIFGRAEEADVVLRSSDVSRQHLQIDRCATGYLVSDLKSRCGSLINGQRFDHHELVIGDHLQLGPFGFQFDGKAMRRVARIPGAAIQTEAISRTTPAGATILEKITLQIGAGDFAGIIGPSGAGKSTLLEVISGMRKPERGTVRIDGQDLYGGSARKTIGLVPQEDIVHRELSVCEALTFSARLRLGKGTPPLEIHKLVLHAMKQLGIQEHASKRISQLSGGQRKRVSVGVELLAHPAVLFLDEPSSGLDPATEFQLMEVLRGVADTGCTVICTTHVMENVYLMDRLLVLAEGRLAFSGSPLDAREHFKVDRLSAIYDLLGSRSKSAGEAKAPALPDAGTELSDWKPKSHSPNSPFALPILLQRQWAILGADRKNFAILLGQPLLIGALVSWVTNDASLALFFAYVATLWFGCSNAAQEIVRELPIFKRERIVGVGAHAYLISKFVFLGVVTGLQAMVLYLVLQLGELGLGGSVPWQTAGLLSMAAAAVGIGLGISALARSVMQAVLIVPLCLIPMILFSGHPVPAYEMKPMVAAVSRATPSFATQTLMDVSFLWKQPLQREALSDHWSAFRNLNRKNDLRSGEVYQRTRPGFLALLINLLWAVATYVVAWVGLRRTQP